MRYLITGAASGLGLAMHQTLGGIPFVRGHNQFLSSYDAIIHCAVNSSKDVSIDDCYGYVQDNLLLTRELLGIPHKRFVYVSSVDVYTPSRSPFYAVAKVFSEALVRRDGTCPLILRPASLLGLSMRPSSIYRMLTDPGCHLFLSAQSRFNFVLHRDVCEFVAACLDLDFEGTYNIASGSSITLGQVAGQLGLAPEFGGYHYDVGHIDQAPAAKITPAFARSSWKTLNMFIDDLGEKYIGRGRLAA